MNEHPILAQVVLGYCPMINRERAVIASHLTVFPARPDATPDAAALLAALADAWEGEGEALTLNIASETMLRDTMALQPAPNIMIEVPAFMAADPQNLPLLQALHAQGSELMIKGRPAGELPADVLPCFKYSIIELSEERRGSGSAAPQGVTRSIGFVQSGVRNLSQVEDSFKRGASAVLGWPTDEPVGRPGVKGSAPDLNVIVELMNRVQRQEPIDRLEAVLKNDPTLAFRLVRYLNSPAFGLKVEIGSFRHAIMMLGYEKLKRWLALLLASSSNDVNMKPVMFAAVRRGLLMEALVRHNGDEQRSSEMFICGVFSLLDCMMGQPFAQLLKSVPMPQDVVDALVHGRGPYKPYVDLVTAVEAESLFDIRDAAERQMLTVAEVNRALLYALSAARQLG